MKGWLAAIGAALLGLLGFFVERSKRLSEKLKNAKAVSETKTRHVEGLIEGEEIFDEVTKTKLDRDHFHRVRKYGNTQDTNTNTH